MRVSSPDDAHEREAERVAEAMSAGAVPDAPAAKAVGGQERVTSRAAAHGRPRVAAPISLSGGAPLDPQLRDHFEPRFAADFSAVRIHTGSTASQAADALSARAFTSGNDIAFGRGHYAPDTAVGRRLLAHELTHVVQHGTAIPDRVDRDPLPPAEVDKAIDDELDLWEPDAAQNNDVGLRAWATRLVLLLQARPRPVFQSIDEVKAFIDDCEVKANTELDTLGVFSPLAAEGALDLFPKGFPLTWSGRVHAALSMGVNPVALLTAFREMQTALTAASDRLGPGIFASGLPVPIGDSARLRRFVLRVSDADLENASPVRDYAREGMRYLQSRWVVTFAFAWEQMVDRIAEAVADGSIVPNTREYHTFVDQKQAVLRDLPRRAREWWARSEDEATQFQSDAVKLADGALFVGMASGLYGLLSLLSGWSEVSAGFDAGLAAADRLVAGAGRFERLGKALVWAWENGYVSGAAAEWWHNLIAHGPEMLAEIGTILVLGMIPGVDIAVAIYLAVTAARDVIGMIAELGAAISDVMAATTVTQLQTAALRLARIMVNGGILIAIVLLTAGVGKSVARLRKGAAELRAADVTLTEEAAMKKSLEKMTRAEREALETGPARLAKKFQPLAEVCNLGSINCRVRLPQQVLNEAGAYATARNVSMPGGPFTVRKSILSGVQRGTEHLRQLCRDNRAMWPEFDRALAAAERRGLDWPRDGGVPWEVHHVKPVFMGGDNVIVNLHPLPKAVHQTYTNWWTKVHTGFKRRFTASEWDLIYSNQRNVAGSRVPQGRVR